ncbi:MAG: 4Fe-4S dicluster domain-containing protein [Candidatus Helarchaeota archaeon]
MSRIESIVKKCTGCLICQFQCSFQYHKEFNPAKARIRIEQSPYDVQSIKFTSDCTNCGICAQFCAYGALKLIQGEEN